jgi:peptidoglycan hydrolase CwlO-like protein
MGVFVPMLLLVSGGASYMEGDVMSTVVVSNEFRSPLRKLVRFFQDSRDNWKQKCQEAKRQCKRLSNQVRAVENSRAQWRSRAEQFQQQVAELEQQLAELKR